MKENPSAFTRDKGGGPDHPVERIAYEMAVEFCKKLSALPAEKAAGRSYRLPTEAEWEYACRAGTTTAFNTGSALKDDQACFAASKKQTTRPVGSYKPNAWGLYDM